MRPAAGGGSGSVQAPIQSKKRASGQQPAGLRFPPEFHALHGLTSPLAGVDVPAGTGAVPVPVPVPDTEAWKLAQDQEPGASGAAKHALPALRIAPHTRRNRSVRVVP